jgi:hypothetical protein
MTEKPYTVILRPPELLGPCGRQPLNISNAQSTQIAHTGFHLLKGAVVLKESKSPLLDICTASYGLLIELR